MEEVGGTVLVTGGSGYIAGFIIRALLAEGWTVNTTVRDLGREAQLRAQLGGDYASLRFFQVDLQRSVHEINYTHVMIDSIGAS